MSLIYNIMNDFDIVKFNFELPAEYSKLDEMIQWAKKRNYDHDVDYYIVSKVTMSAIVYIVFDRKQFSNNNI